MGSDGSGAPCQFQGIRTSVPGISNSGATAETAAAALKSELRSSDKRESVPLLVRVFGWLGIKGGGNERKAVKLYGNSNVFMVSRTTLNKPMRTALSRGCLSPACCAARAARRRRTRSVGVCVVVITQRCLRRVAARAQLDVRLLPMWAVPYSSACSLVGLRQVGPAIR